MMDERRVIWGDDGFASKSGWAFAHLTDTSTGELISSDDVWVVVGTGLPAGAFLDNPPLPEDGKAIVRNDNGEWRLVDDFRGSTAYNKHTKNCEVVSELGALSSDLTLLTPESHFDVWSDESGTWVKDEQAEQEFLTQQASYIRTNLLGEASNEIAALQDAIDPDITSTPSDSAHDKLIKWKKYRAALAVIDCSYHPVMWPEKP